MSSSNPTTGATAADTAAAGTTTAAAPSSPQSPDTAQGPVFANIPADIQAEEFSDDTSEIGTSIASSSTSISDSIRGFREENGRTYHKYKDGKYNLPNDERENQRLNLQHNIFLLSFDDALGLAPPNDPGSKVKRVLDVGTGTGIWAVDFADEHPDAQVFGIDLSPSMSDFVPPNVKFEINDLEEDWTWSEPFDYIITRMMNSSIGDWRAYAKKAFENLTPGGYIEMQDIDLYPRSDDGTFRTDSQFYQCIKYIEEASIILGRPFQDIPSLTKVLEDVGFINVKIQLFKWPTSAWPKDVKYKELGSWHNQNLNMAIEALTMAPFTRALGWTREEVQIFLSGVRKEMNNRNIHSYWAIYVIYGQKPLEKEAA